MEMIHQRKWEKWKITLFAKIMMLCKDHFRFRAGKIVLINLKQFQLIQVIEVFQKLRVILNKKVIEIQFKEKNYIKTSSFLKQIRKLAQERKQKKNLQSMERVRFLVDYQLKHQIKRTKLTIRVSCKVQKLIKRILKRLLWLKM